MATALFNYGTELSNLSYAFAQAITNFFKGVENSKELVLCNNLHRKIIAVINSPESIMTIFSRDQSNNVDFLIAKCVLVSDLTDLMEKTRICSLIALTAENCFLKTFIDRFTIEVCKKSQSKSMLIKELQKCSDMSTTSEFINTILHDVCSSLSPLPMSMDRIKIFMELNAMNIVIYAKFVMYTCKCTGFSVL